MQISINSLTANAVREESYNGRPFVVLNAMLIRGDTSMNGIFYPLDEVKKSFNQLEDIDAPLGHPKVQDQFVSAKNNFVKGAHNVGAFVKNVHMKDKEVHGEIYIDKEVANQSEKGRTLLERIANKAKLGVSTGLLIAKTIAQNGVDDLGKAFNRIGQGFSFDHLAILNGETAAGEHAGTEIIFNSEQSLFVINHDDGGQPESNQRGNSMKIEIDVSDLAKADRVKLESLTANELLQAVTAEKPQVTVNEAQELLESKGLQVNSAEAVVMTKDDHAELKANADKFVEAETARLDEIRESITANSKMTAEDLAGMTETALTKLADSLVPANNFEVNGAQGVKAPAATAYDFSPVQEAK